MLSKLVALVASRQMLQTVRSLRLNCVAQSYYYCSSPSVPHCTSSTKVRQPVWLRKDVSSSTTSYRNQKRQYCAVRQSEVSYEELQALMRSKDIKLIDVREPQELTQFGRIEGSVNIPLGELHDALNLPPDQFEKKYSCEKPEEDDQLVFHCMLGRRSLTALALASKLGYSKARHYKGGWVEYAQKSGQPEKTNTNNS